MAQDTEQLVYLDPSKVQTDANVRFSLKGTRIESLKQSIVEQGGIIEPVEVVKLDKPANGFTHRLTVGFYRHAALDALNKEGAGLKLPAIVRDAFEGADRIKRQVAENNDRENMSPMDKAIAIKQLVDVGVEKAEIRRIFSAAGGRKGNVVQPMSNSMLNIHLRFLELPKAIQEKIHDGRVGVEAAYTLGKVAPDKRAAVLERAEADRIALIEQEEKDEAKYLLSEKKMAEAEAAATTAAAEVVTSKTEVQKAEELIKEKTKAYATVKNAILTSDKPAGKEETEQLKAAETDVKAAQKLLKDAKNRVAKALTTVESAKETAERQRAVLEAARKAVKPKKKEKAIGKTDIEKASKATGANAGYVPLSLSDIRQCVKDLMAEGSPARVAQVGRALKDCFDGKTTTKQLIEDLSVVLKGATTDKPAAPPAKTMPAAPDVVQGPKARKTAAAASA